MFASDNWVSALEPRRMLMAAVNDPFAAEGDLLTQKIKGEIVAPVAAAQLDGKIVVAFGTSSDEKHYTVERFGPSGGIDKTFGNSGQLHVSGNGYYQTQIEIDSKNRILLLAGGRLVRLNSRGKFDVSFGDGGVYTKSSVVAFAAPDGRIMIDADKIRRLTLRGAIDSSFHPYVIPNVYTTVSTDFERTILFLDDYRLQPDGSMVVLVSGAIDDGEAYSGPVYAFRRITPAGKIDRHFGNNGISAANLDYQDFAVTTDGHIVAIDEGAVVELTPNGLPDSAFGETDFGNGTGTALGIKVAHRVLEAANGEIVVMSGGQVGDYQDDPLVIWNLSADGKLVNMQTTFDTRPLVPEIATAADGSAVLLFGQYTDTLELKEVTGSLPARISRDGALVVRGTSGRNDIELRVQQDGTVDVDMDEITENFPASAIKSVLIDAAGGNDFISVDAQLNVPVTALGGNGSDTIYGDDGAELLGGGAGNDFLYPQSLDTTLAGGAGIDTADFSNFTYLFPGDLFISLDDRSNDGPIGGHMNVHADIENIIGGSGNDLIIGGPSAEHLYGGPGNDTLWGGGGNDTLEGGRGHDQLFGQAGDDLLIARDGLGDSLDGGDGFDTAGLDDLAAVKDQAVNVEAFV